MSNISQFDAHPSQDVIPASPLHHTAALPKETAGIVLTEIAFLDHMIIRGESADLASAIKSVTGIELPQAPQSVNRSETSSIQWLSPDEWLLIVPSGEGFAVQSELRNALANAHFSIVDVSGGQTLLQLKGAKAYEVLMKSTVYNVDPNHFAIGKGVTSIFAKATAIIRRSDSDTWELVVRRSFADYCWRWLIDASQEFGVSWQPESQANSQSTKNEEAAT